MFFNNVLSLAAATSLVLPALALPHARWVRRQENAQTSLTLDPAVISPGLAQDGQGDNPDPGQVRSLTSTNNYINFCLTQNVPLTNGKQVADGSCNQTPMGRIIPLDNSSRCKFVFPPNGDDSLVAGQAFTIQMKIQFLQTGAFTNPQSTYYAAPQQLNGGNVVIGHSHVVIEELPDLQTTEPLDPLAFKFFKGLNNAAQNDILTTDVSDGLDAGVYRMCSINTAANHQPVIVSNAQHGALDDCVYFTVREPGQAQEQDAEENNNDNNDNDNNGQNNGNGNNNNQEQEDGGDNNGDDNNGNDDNGNDNNNQDQGQGQNQQEDNQGQNQGQQGNGQNGQDDQNEGGQDQQDQDQGNNNQGQNQDQDQDQDQEEDQQDQAQDQDQQDQQQGNNQGDNQQGQDQQNDGQQNNGQNGDRNGDNDNQQGNNGDGNRGRN